LSDCFVLFVYCLDPAGCGSIQLKSRSRTGSASLEVSSATNAGGGAVRNSNGSIAAVAKIGAIQVKILFTYISATKIINQDVSEEASRHSLW
jgi:hypothetical protein